MQDRYVGDIGDFSKFSFLNAIAGEDTIGIAWYLFPDEDHNDDGRHVGYLSDPTLWRDKDPFVFDRLRHLVETENRSISAVQSHGVLRSAVFSGQRLECDALSYRSREKFRTDWFKRVLSDLSDTKIAFADPDNGLREQEKYKFGNRKNWKSIPESEVRKLADSRTAVIYHHNTRRKGGHIAEISYWLERLNADFAVRMRANSARSFFVINAQPEHESRARAWCAQFGPKFSLVKR